MLCILYCKRTMCPNPTQLKAEMEVKTEGVLSEVNQKRAAFKYMQVLEKSTYF